MMMQYSLIMDEDFEMINTMDDNYYNEVIFTFVIIVSKQLLKVLLYFVFCFLYY